MCSWEAGSPTLATHRWCVDEGADAVQGALPQGSGDVVHRAIPALQTRADRLTDGRIASSERCGRHVVRRGGGA